MHTRLFAFPLAALLALSVGCVHRAGDFFGPTYPRVTINASSGEDGVTLANSGARLVFNGPGGSDYLRDVSGVPTFALGLSAPSITLSASTNAVILTDGSKVCLDGATCNNYLSHGGGQISINTAVDHFSFNAFASFFGDVNMASKNDASIVLSYSDGSGTPGSATNSNARGRNAVASGASVATITNSVVTSSMLVQCQLETAAAGVAGVVCVPGSGSFTATTVNGTGAVTNATANAKFSFVVIK